MKKSIFFSLFIFIGFAVNTFAANDYKAYSKSLPQLIVGNQIQQIGDIHLPSLIGELDQVTWVVNDKPILEGSGKPRFACNYFIKEKKVICDGSASSAAVLPLLTLHEALGALGYLDEDYQISSALAIYALTRTNMRIEGVIEYLTNIKKRTDDEVYKTIAGTSVGGGGDSVGITIKTFAVAAFVNMIKTTRLTKAQKKRSIGAIKRMMAAAFENNVVDDSMRVVVIDGIETVYISYSKWTQIQMNTTAPDVVAKQVELFDPILEYFSKPL